MASENVTAIEMIASRGRPKDPEKRQAIFEAAKHLFPQKGFSGTSMEDIARLAGVSKLTLYSHFKDKEELFRASIEDVISVSSRIDAAEAPWDADRPAHALGEVGAHIMQIILGPRSLDMQRMVISEARHHPAIAAAYASAGMGGMLQQIEILLYKIMHKNPGFDFAPLGRSAALFYGMLKADLHPLGLYQAEAFIDARRLADHIDHVVEVFLRAHKRPQK